MDHERLLIRSYRLCFALERRIHRIDRWRIPVPYGVPLRGIAYAAVALAAVILLARVPIAGELLGALHPALRLVILPVGAAYLACRLRIDGRPAHAAALAWTRFRMEPRLMVGFRARAERGTERIGDVTVAPDEGSARLRPALLSGPADVLLRYPVRARRRGRTLAVAQSSGGPMWRGKQIRLGKRQRLVVR